MIGARLKIVEKGDEVSVVAEGTEQEIGVECAGSGVVSLGEHGGPARGFARLHPYRFQPHGTPGDVSSRQAYGSQQIVDSLWQDAAIGDLCGTGLFREEDLAVLSNTWAAVP